jgi:hypothetical protein
MEKNPSEVHSNSSSQVISYLFLESKGLFLCPLVLAAGVQCAVLALVDKLYQMLRIIQHLDKHCSCHLQGECEMATAMFAKMLIILNI